MQHLVIALILHLLQLEPNHPVNQNEEYRKQLAGHYVEAAEEYKRDPFLLVVWSFEESSLRVDARGALGEIGLFQVHGKAKETCEAAGYNLSDERSQIFCGALLFDLSSRYCASLKRGLYRYASGRCAGTPRARRITKRRLKRVERLKGKIK